MSCRGHGGLSVVSLHIRLGAISVLLFEILLQTPIQTMEGASPLYLFRCASLLSTELPHLTRFLPPHANIEMQNQAFVNEFFKAVKRFATFRISSILLGGCIQARF